MLRFAVAATASVFAMAGNDATDIGGDPRRLFVQHIPPDATMADVLRSFERFGAVAHACFVPSGDPGGHSGRCFVDFADADAGQRCLDASYQNAAASGAEPVAVRGQTVLVIRAATKAEIDAKKRPKDKRNLHLMYEGHITPDMAAARGLPEAELAKRRRLWEQKQEKLADTNNSVSETRLAVFNAPPGAGTGQMRKIFAVAPKKYARTHRGEELSNKINESTPRITEVRKKEGQEGVFFLEFSKPEHALGALRMVNNNPNYFQDRRLIVEFAIVNSFATKKRREKEAMKKKLREKRFADREPAKKEEFEDEEGFEVAEESDE